MSQVTLEEVRRVAELANLELTPAEEPAIERDLNAILAYFALLNRLDTAALQPMAQVGDALARVRSEDGVELRFDQVRPSLPRKAVLGAAPESDGRFFKVPKVIERQ
jgi:aspartyl-tRNA(Asn)/glutamyl-tRNA(Gln) amidotransferase subunit C